MRSTFETVAFALLIMTVSGCLSGAAQDSPDPVASRAYGVVELRSDESTREGDVLITTQAEADEIACVTVIEGALTVRPSEPVVTLPNLVEVTGDVLIEVEDTVADDFQPAAVAALPMLERVGGTLRYHHFDGHYGSDVQIGLPKLSSLCGDLSLVLSSFNTHVEGLPGLTSIGGSLDVEAEGDFYPFGLLGALSRVDSDLRIHSHGAGSSGGILRELREVGSDVQLDALGLQNDSVLERLETIGGQLRIHNSYWGEAHFTALSRVGGAFSVRNGGTAGLDENSLAGAPDLILGAFELEYAPFAVVPLVAGARVASTGTIAIENNADLCQASVDAFVTAQQLDGWAGALHVSDNVGSCM